MPGVLISNLLYNVNAPIDARYYDPRTQLPWESDTIVKNYIIQSVRYLGLTVAIATTTGIKEYWWKSNTTNDGLVEKGGTTYTNGNGITITSAQEIKIDETYTQTVSNLKQEVSSANADVSTYYPSVNAVKTYVDGIITSAFNDRGNYSPSLTSPGPYPSTGGSGVSEAIKAGDFWSMYRDGYLLTTSVQTGSIVRALEDTPGQDPTKWAILNTGIGYLAENTTNKVPDKSYITSNSTSTILYPSVKAVYDFVTSSVATPGLTAVLSTAPSGDPAGNVAKNKDIIIRTTTSTDSGLTVENKYSTNKQKVKVLTDGVSVYSNATDGAYTKLKHETIDISDGTTTKTFTFPLTSGALALAGSSIAVISNSGLDLSSTNQLKTVYNTLKTGNTTSTVGGIPSGTAFSELKTLTLVDLLDKMFAPTQNPTYTIPKLTTTGTGDLSATSSKEIGVYISGTVKIEGVKNDAGPFTAIDFYKEVNGSATLQSTTLQTVTPAPGDISNQFGYSDPNNPNSGKFVLYTEPASSYQVPTPLTSSGVSTVSYYGIASYSAGSAKKDSAGNDDTRAFLVRNTNAPQAASPAIPTPPNPPTPPDFQSSSITVTGYYPIFYGTYNVGTTQPTSATIKTLIQTKSYSSSTSYAINDLTVNGTTIYKCTTATSGTFNPAHWTQIGTRVKTIASGGSDISATFGNTGSDVRWWFIAQDNAFLQKVYWSQVGNPLSTNVPISGNYAVSTQSITSPDILTGSTPLWSNRTYNIYISNLKASSDSASQVYKYTVSTI